MAIKFDFEASEAEQLLMDDSFTKLCTVVFPVETARLPVVMHYDVQSEKPTLVYQCNAYIHYRRVNPPSALRINGIPTKKYAVVPCSDYSESEVTDIVDYLNASGYYAYTVVVNGKVKLYISWDEQCLTPVPQGEE